MGAGREWRQQWLEGGGGMEGELGKVKFTGFIWEFIF